jgi:hypothetical protein
MVNFLAFRRFMSMMRQMVAHKRFSTLRKVGERLQIGSEETAADKPEGFFYKGRRVRMEWNRAGSLKEFCDHPGW